MAELFTIRPLEWEVRSNNFHSKNSVYPISIFLSLVDLETFDVWLGTRHVGEN